MFNASGLQALVARYGDWFSYSKSPRAQIFQRNQSLVHDLDSMVRLMRWAPIRQGWLWLCPGPVGVLTVWKRGWQRAHHCPG